MKDLDVREKAKLLRQVAHPTRLLILAELAKGVKCVTDIQGLLEIPQSNVSQHLQVLRQARLVDFYEDGQLCCYYLLRPAFARALHQLLSGEYPIEKRDRESVRQEGADGSCLRDERRREQAGSVTESPLDMTPEHKAALGRAQRSSRKQTPLTRSRAVFGVAYDQYEP